MKQPSMREIARTLGIDHKAVAYHRDRGMPVDSIEAACQYWIRYARPPYTRSKLESIKRAAIYLGQPVPRWAG